MLSKQKTENEEKSDISDTSNKEVRNMALFKSKLAILKGENDGN